MEPSLPPLPEAARRAFPPPRIPLIERYAGLLASDGVVRGLIGPREVPRLWERHIANSAVLAPVIDQGATVCDIGSGAGLPGLVLAIQRPDLSVTLVEPLLRRTTFLTEVVAELELDNVEVVRARADALHGTRSYDVVTSRAVAPLGRLLEWSMPLVGPYGVLLALKGSSIEDEIAESRPTLARLGCAEPEVLELSSEAGAGSTRGVRVSWADPSALRLPPEPAKRASAGKSGRSGKARRSKRRQG